jgi:hypothetical protein
MSYNDPRFEPIRSSRSSEKGDNAMWIAGTLAVCVVVGLIVFATVRTPSTATNTLPTVTTAPRAPAPTTGATSGTKTQGETTGAGNAASGTVPPEPQPQR